MTDGVYAVWLCVRGWLSAKVQHVVDVDDVVVGLGCCVLYVYYVLRTSDMGDVVCRVPCLCWMC